LNVSGVGAVPPSKSRKALNTLIRNVGAGLVSQGTVQGLDTARTRIYNRVGINKSFFRLKVLYGGFATGIGALVVSTSFPVATVDIAKQSSNSKVLHYSAFALSALVSCVAYTMFDNARQMKVYDPGAGLYKTLRSPDWPTAFRGMTLNLARDSLFLALLTEKATLFQTALMASMTTPLDIVATAKRRNPTKTYLALMAGQGFLPRAYALRLGLAHTPMDFLYFFKCTGIRTVAICGFVMTYQYFNNRLLKREKSKVNFI